MADHERSDEEIIAEERRRYRQRMRWTFLSLFVWLGLALVLVEAFRLGVFQRIAVMLNISGAVAQYVPELLLSLMWFFLLVVLLRFRRPKDSLRPSVLRKQVDDYQSRQRGMMLLFVALVFVMCLSAIPSPLWIAGGNSFSNWFHALVLPFVVTLCTLFVSIGPGFLSKRYRPAIDDELSRSLRGKATKVGYTLAMILLAAAYLVAGARPGWSLAAFPLLLFAGFAIPALYLAWLEWRASQSG